jgi:DNA-binding IclR family transcriptional regulator
MSLANAAAVLHWLKRDHLDVAVGELATAKGWPKSSTSRLLSEMQKLGLLERDPVTRRYRLGLMMLELATRYRAGEPVVEAADAALADITRQTGHATGISLLDGIEVVVLRSRAGTQPLRVVTPPGDRGPAWATSTGRALLARLPDAEIARRFARFPNSARPAAPASLDALMQRIRRVRAQGWDEAADEQVPGLGAVSVVLHDPHAGEAMALYVAFSALHVNRQERRELAQMLLEMAARLRSQFGIEAEYGPETVAPRLQRRAHG